MSADILSAEEIAGALVKIAPDEPWPLLNGDWFTRLCASHEALRRLVERLTAERDAARRWENVAEWYCDSASDFSERREAALVELRATRDALVSSRSDWMDRHARMKERAEAAEARVAELTALVIEVVEHGDVPVGWLNRADDALGGLR